MSVLPPLHDDLQPHQRIALIAHNLIPGRVPSISLGAQVARSLVGKDHPLLVGPAAPEEISALDIQLPEHSEYRDGIDVIRCVNTNSDPATSSSCRSSATLCAQSPNRSTTAAVLCSQSPRTQDRSPLLAAPR
jgi:hypothetical protein